MNSTGPALAAPASRQGNHWLALLPLLAIVAANLFLALHIIPRFTEIYEELWSPGFTLPYATRLILRWQSLLASVAYGSLFAGILVIWLASSRIAWNSVLVITLLALFQLGFAVCFLLVPLADLIEKAQPPQSHGLITGQRAN